MRVENKKLEDWLEFLSDNRYLPMSDKSSCPSNCNNTNFTETEGYEDDKFIIHTYKCDCKVLFYKLENK